MRLELKTFGGPEGRVAAQTTTHQTDWQWVLFSSRRLSICIEKIHSGQS